MTASPVVIHLDSDGRSPMAGPSRLPALHYKRALAHLLPEPDPASTPAHGQKAKAKGPAGRIEAHLRTRGWEPTWRFGMYKHAHYHATTHELLAVFSGTAHIQLGGVSPFAAFSPPISPSVQEAPVPATATRPSQPHVGPEQSKTTERQLHLEPGDVLLLPAGYTHFALKDAPSQQQQQQQQQQTGAEPFLMVGAYPQGAAPWDMRFPGSAAECERAAGEIEGNLLTRPRKGLFDARDPVQLEGAIAGVAEGQGQGDAHSTSGASRSALEEHWDVSGVED